MQICLVVFYLLDAFSYRCAYCEDILGYLGQHKRDGQVICGFSMETQDVIKNSEKKLTNKNCDMICANSLRTAGAGFGTETNIITIITADDEQKLPLMSKEEAAHRILDRILKMKTD